jgi:recombination protein RecA
MAARRRRAAPKKAVVKKDTIKGELGDTIGAINKRYGGNTCRTGTSIVQPGRISTGTFMLDFALLGGIPDNRISMVVGERHAGKSTMANKIIACAQQQEPDKTCVYIDVEGTYESTWAGHLGVDNDRLRVADCETGEMAVDIADAVVRSKESSLIVIDSIAALVPMKEIEDSAEDAHVALQARLVGRMIRKVSSGLIAERKRGHFVTVLLINQFRNKIGGYGDPRTVPGGKALEFATSLQWIMKNKEVKGRSDNEIESMTHNEHSFYITKNKMNAGPRAGEFQLCRQYDPETGLGIGDVDEAATMLVYAKKFGAYTGGGQKWVLDFDDIRETFTKASKAIEWMYAEPVMHRALRDHLIRCQAAALDMKPEFIKTIG